MSTVHVKGISSQTSEKEVRDFFSFCGKISSLSVTKESNAADAGQTASVTFEKETAASTALLLDNTQLGPAQVHVSRAASLDQIAGGKTAGSADENTKDDLPQEEKPRSRIAAEMLARGYVLSDVAINRALALDKQHGISERFTTALTQFDQRVKVSERAAQVDKSYGVTTRANQGWQGLNSYFEKALGTPTGQRLRAFYEVGQKQVLDVHNEAKHLASLQTGNKEGGIQKSTVPGTDRTKCNCSADAGVCTCAPGDCACSSCAKNPDEKTTNVTAEQAEMEKVTVDGKEKTKCNCGSESGKCPCEPGKCACSGCAKAS